MLAARLSRKACLSPSTVLSREQRGFVRASRRSFAVSAFAHQQRHQSFQERVLRYPDGVERRIIYPVDDAGAAENLSTEDDIVFGGDVYRSYGEELQPDRWAATEDWDVSDLWSGLFDEPRAIASAAAAPAVTDQQQQDTTQPLDILEQLTSRSYRETQQQYWERIGNSYQVLDGCPWLMPKPLHVLAVPQLTVPQAAMFTLQTRISQQQLENELSKVLGRRQTDGSSVLSVDRLVEGIVAFEDEAAAEAFGHALEAAGHQDVSLATADSHELFRLSTSSSAVVVLMRQGTEELPTPGELEVSLRRQRQSISGL